MQNNMRTGVFEYTTDPNTAYLGLFHWAVFLSIFAHTFAYALSAVVLYFVIYGDVVSLMLLLRFCVYLLVSMPFGYIGRLARAKRLRRIHSEEETRDMMRTAYFCWYFLG